MPYSKPTKTELLAAVNKTVPDVIASNLQVLLCGINPGLYTAAVGRHFARPGNRFWPALHDGGFTPRLLSPFEEDELLQYGLGITNLVRRATATAAELSLDELVRGARRLRTKVRKFQPRVLAVLGVTAYRAAFNRPQAALGLQEETFGPTHVWLLPSPSGLNAHYQRKDFAKVFSELREFVEEG